MKAKKKSTGIKQKIREGKKRERRVALAFAVAVLVIIISISGFFVYSMLNHPSSQTILEPKAAIVDHLSLTVPNQTFIETATNTLKQAGYTVDYYPGEKVTVEFYRNLPTHGYSIIILRVHSAVGPENQPPLALFTSEPISTDYAPEQIDDRLQGVAFLPYKPADPTFFGIPPKFVRLSMNGKFQNTIVIAMGCDGLTYTGMAEAFEEKGAKVYIGWKGSVLASHTDQATTHLLQHLVTEKQTIKNAIAQTMEEVGPDPVDESPLIYHPSEVEDQTIEDILGN